MVTYVFRCKTCDRTYDLSTRVTSETCCDQPLTRVYSVSGITFKGSGFYVNERQSS